MPASDVAQLELKAVDGGVELTVKVVPGASRSRLVGVWGGALKLAVCAPPEGGRANEELLGLLAGALGVRRCDVRLGQGRSRPVKRVFVRGTTVAAARAALGAALSGRS